MYRSSLIAAAPLLAGLLLAPACSSDDGSSATCDMPGGMVSGAADSHCGSTVVTVDPGACTPDMADAGAGAPDAGAGTGDDDFGDTLYGVEGDDDDCKYHMTWSSTTVCENQDVTFHVHLTALDGGAAETGAKPYIEAFLDDTHPAPNSGATFTDKGGGDYDIGPMRFDAAGRWTVRFHFFSDCADSEESPHGHAAFFVDVP